VEGPACGHIWRCSDGELLSGPSHLGEGGAVLTDKPNLQLLIESFRDWGRDCWCEPGEDNTCGKLFDWQLGSLRCGCDHKYTYSHIGYNLKATDMQAARGASQITKLPDFIEPEKQTFDMVFVLRSSTKRKVKREIYTYDKDLNLVNTVKDEQEIEQMKKKYKWFNFKGDSYVSHSLSASANLTGKLVFRKKEITWKYLWLTGGYNKSVKQLEKVKATNEGSGEKYFFRGGSYEVKPDSTVLVIAGRQEKKNDLAGSMMHYDILSCDNQVNIKTLGKIEFEHPNIPIYSAALDDDNSELDNDDYPRDWVTVFAPQSGGGGVDKGLVDPNKNNYTYVRMNTQGEIIEKFSFQSPSNGWRVLGAYDHDGSVFLYGSANNKDADKYINQIFKTVMVPTTSADDDEKEGSSSGNSIKGGLSLLTGSADLGVTQSKIDEVLDQLKYTNFQIGKISNGKFDFLSWKLVYFN